MRGSLFVASAALWAVVFVPPASGAEAEDPTVAALQKAVLRSPQDDVAHYNLGVAYFTKRRYAEASGEFGRSLQINPKNGDARKNLASSYVNDAMAKLAAGDAEATEDLCKKAIAVQAMPEAYYNLALAQLRRNESQPALASLRKAAELAPLDPDPHRILGQLALQAGDLDTAVTELEQGRKLGMAEPAALLALATAYEHRAAVAAERGDKVGTASALDRAREAIEASLKAQPSVEGFFEKGVVLYRQERFSEAIDSYQKALALDSHHALSRYNLACLYSYRAQFDEAADEFRKIPESDSAYPEALKNIGYCMAMSVEKRLESGGRKLVERDFRGAIADLQRLLQLDPGHPKAAQLLKSAQESLKGETARLNGEAEKLFAVGNAGDAVRRWQEVLGLDPDDARAKQGLAKANVKMRELVAVLLQDGRAKLAESDFTGASAQLSRIVQADAKALEAKQLEAEIAKSRSAAAQAGLADGGKAVAAGKYRDAQAAYERVLRVDPQNALASRDLILLTRRVREDVETRLKSGLALRDQGQKEKAKEKLLSVLDLDPANKEAREAIRALTGQQARQVENAEKVRDFYYKGIDYYTNGQLEQAIEQWQKVLSLEPQHYEANINIQKARRKIEILKQFKGKG